MSKSVYVFICKHIVVFALSAVLIEQASIAATDESITSDIAIASQNEIAQQDPKSNLEKEEVNVPVSNDGVKKDKSFSPFVEGQLTNAILGLVFVIGMVLLSAWFVRRTNLVRYGQEQQLKVLSSFSLGNKEKIMLVQANGVEILIGVTAHHIQSLHVFEEVTDKASLISDDVKSRSETTNERSKKTSTISASFSEKLSEMLERGRLG